MQILNLKGKKSQGVICRIYPFLLIRFVTHEKKSLELSEDHIIPLPYLLDHLKLLNLSHCVQIKSSRACFKHILMVAFPQSAHTSCF